MKRTLRRFGGIVVALVIAAPTVFATVAMSRTRPGNFLWTAGTTVNVPLNAAGATSATWSGSGKFAITYSAECTDGGDENSWVSLQIIVNGVTLAPTAGTLDAFCSGDATPGTFDNWRTHSITVVTPTLASGTHTIVVQATEVDNTGSAPNAGGWLSDSALVIHQ